MVRRRRGRDGPPRAHGASGRRLPLRGVRVQAALVATLVVAATLAVAALAFVALQRDQLEASLAQLAAQQASDVAAEAADVGPAEVELTAVGAGERALIQVVDADGRVLAASPAAVGKPALVAARPRPGASATVHADQVPIDEDDQFVVVAQGVSTSQGPVVVLAAQSLEAVERSTSVVAGLFAAGYLPVLLVVAATSYWLTGRALAPVESMRRRVAGITSTDLSARVPPSPAGDEMTRLAETMNDMLAGLEAASLVQRRFVADASHELRSPLATIRAELEVARQHPAGVDWDAVSADVLEEADRLDQLVADLLLLARADEHAHTLRREDVDLDDLVLDEARRLRTAGTEVAVHAPPVRVVGDGRRLQRVVRNLADNAVLHGRGRVSLTVRQEGPVAVVEVADDGPGIPAERREQVFDRFVRLDDSRGREAGGTGLGLPIAREIARAHGGDLRVGESAVGTRMILTLPRDISADAPAPRRPGDRAPQRETVTDP
ncbi:cell wall metabolism sensor histidine kinase WalK [Georgenia sp. SYP-B2076]|uniref:sensor histidine kinase n=1 Tax=Georgenia sp. SYP-B2076 TaxID=2495881 RepID=UPI000F8E39CA|nr:HAMP domain-containing sensor histidine kinase [Georgenia sp. SYP-B2076]